MGILNQILAHPLTRGLSIDDPHTTELRRQIIVEKPFLKSIYQEWYGRILDALPYRDRVLELGSGAGFFKEVLPNAITSEIFPVKGVDVVADACNLRFSDGELDAIVMTDVLHHIPGVDRFFAEASRCLRTGGRIVMIEPWRTPWSEWVYTHLHHEPFEPSAGWDIPATGPLSGANGALPWIVFSRDREEFRRRFPKLEIVKIEPIMPISYLVSGGVSLRSLVPKFLYKPVRWLEGLLPAGHFAMFALIQVERLP
ncbi:class I SAM-dependent methyltransferase [Roseibium sediminis]|uniref:class I SAM-dependent methyltransferase n=1 Tax=Roseibium sediminis TaxID=1775174 RepID=UPI001AD8B459|nr:methyltransferase domain-containing protein [Roseibium sediminis]